MKMPAATIVTQNSNRFYFPKRYIVVILGFTGMFNTYTMRINLSVALVAMVNSSKPDSESNAFNSSNECPMQNDEQEYIHRTEYNGERYNWDPEMQGHVLSSFFYGYCITGFCGGYVAERFGAIRVFGGGLFLTGLLTLLTPFAVTWGVVPLMVIRALEGLTEGVALPAMTAIVSRWSPKLERTRISAIILSGITFGTVVTMWLSGWLSSISFFGGWPSIFYITGFTTCVWYVLWMIFMYETPNIHPYITPEELSLFQRQEEKPQVFKVPWKEIFTSLPFWAVVMANIGCLFGLFLLQTELPTFLSTSLHFDVKNVGLLSALPYVFYCLSTWIASCCADRLRSSGRFRTTTIRKLFQGIAGYGAGLCLLAITVSGCRPFVIMALFSLSLGFKGFLFSGYNITHTDMSPDFAGTLYGLSNGISSFSGILGPVMVGYFTSNGYTLENWNKVFYITVAIYFATTTFFIVFASAELQSWGNAKNSKYENESNMTFVTSATINNVEIATCS